MRAAEVEVVNFMMERRKRMTLLRERGNFSETMWVCGWVGVYAR